MRMVLSTASSIRETRTIRYFQIFPRSMGEIVTVALVAELAVGMAAMVELVAEPAGGMAAMVVVVVAPVVGVTRSAIL
ncbi:hypothetical protein AO721_05725 [Aeromonas veronii]|nr:hypothetical protein A6033_12920 [Aeromonas veronii]KRV65970.1 hypothetical protein AO728_05840 [Aeromonas veronii]KRV76863.1 hypothetical protein AO719_05540 [Aeromonas veronii]KRV86893.1 hypothetical protein AO721_05725 [Aeromonas veronii]KRV87651.1 hypothetical protein AO739_04995 [Aeromonas veronii]